MIGPEIPWSRDIRRIASALQEGPTDIAHGYAGGVQADEHVEVEVRRFLAGALAVAFLQRHDELCRLLGDLLQAEILVVEETHDVRAGGPLFPTPADQCLKLFVHRRGPEEARDRMKVARGAFLLHLREDCVAVAVEVQGDDPLEVPRLLPLLPEPGARPGVIVHVTGLQSGAPGVAIHERHHQDVAGARILSDRRDEALRPVGLR